MYAEFYAQNPLVFWALAGLVIFVASFVAVLFYVGFSLRERSKVEYLAALPLRPDAAPPVKQHDDPMVEEGSRDE